MDLFSNLIDPTVNLLPIDGIVNYYGTVFNYAKAQFYCDTLFKTIEWKNDEAIIFNKHIITKRKAAWYGDSNYAYTYSNATKYALPFTKELLELKAVAEKLTQSTYNSCLLNLYHNGDEGIAMMKKLCKKMEQLHLLVLVLSVNFLLSTKKLKKPFLYY
jgi:alkylated DNA repair dioxygenase AlkB